jgi:Protein of unknown function (DUF1822)
MIFKFDELMVIYPEQIWVELSSEKKEQAWQNSSSQAYSNAAAQRNAFLNHICLDAFESWLQEDQDLYQNFQLLCHKIELPYFWEILNGIKLSVGGKIITLIPCEKSCLQEFRIQQEWVDIPKLAAHYYLAVQINLAEDWLRVWGYASYKQIREQARYDEMDRTYVLNGEDLITDLNVMWLSLSNFVHQTADTNSLEKLSSSQKLSPLKVEELLEQLSKPTAYSPRLNIPFPEWAAIITSDENRQKLYQRRLFCVQEKLSNQVKTNQSVVNNLCQWLENTFDNAWESVEMLWNLNESSFFVSFRNNSGFNEVRVTGAKVIDLGMQIEGKDVVLLVALTPEDSEKISIRVQLHPTAESIYLPSDLKLILLAQSGKILQEVQSRTHDHYIQLKRFKSTYGNRFSIQVALNNVSIREEFLLEKPIG